LLNVSTVFLKWEVSSAASAIEIACGLILSSFRTVSGQTVS
jgi:hypothetical protein